MKVEIPTATNPTEREMREPQIIRLSMSRPRSSVPNGWDVPGGSRMCCTLIELGLYGVMSGANIAKVTRHITTIPPSTASLFRLKRFQNELDITVSLSSDQRLRTLYLLIDCLPELISHLWSIYPLSADNPSS